MKIISSYCKWDGDQCVQVERVDAATTGGGATVVRWTDGSHRRYDDGWVVQVTDSKLAPDSPIVQFRPDEWDAFLVLLARWAPGEDGSYHIGPLGFTVAEWEAFAAGAAHGEFDYRHLSVAA